jgi:hypothetical protein
MKRIEYRGVVDKSGWPRGPWDDEPDKVQWPDEATGLPCMVKRGPAGSFCGYVGVPSTHPLHGRPYDDVPVMVHGDLTFSDGCEEVAPEKQDDAICHVPEPGEPDDVWWFGFDCAHWCDIMPSMHPEWSYDGMRGKTYRDLEFATEECRALATQLAKLSES